MNTISVTASLQRSSATFGNPTDFLANRYSKLEQDCQCSYSCVSLCAGEEVGQAMASRITEVSILHRVPL